MTEKRGSLLDVKDLRVAFTTYRGIIKALNGVELWLNEGERLGIVGETGCGKSVTSLALMQLIEDPGEVKGGTMSFEDKSVDLNDDEAFSQFRGKDLSMIFQEPVAALNPVMKVGFQIAENMAVQKGLPKRKYRTLYPEAREMLKMVGLDPKRTMNLYPHELSGGMAQRVMIAMALSSKPKLLIADEPTSALDVTIQAQILDLLDNLVKDMGAAVILITHDMGVAAEFCDKVMVMYAGNTVEFGDVFKVFENPLHPYTRGLLKAVPRMGQREELQGIAGEVPDLVYPPSGCRFHPRCDSAMECCTHGCPPLTEVEPGHYTACYLYGSDEDDK